MMMRSLFAQFPGVLEPTLVNHRDVMASQDIVDRAA